MMISETDGCPKMPELTCMIVHNAFSLVSLTLTRKSNVFLPWA